jgi:DNA-binding CsgD family transcriptional regulator
MDDTQVLAQIERLYRLEDGPCWQRALTIVSEVLQARAGIVLEQARDGYRVKAHHGASFDWRAEPLLSRGTGQNSDRIGLHTQHEGRTVIWLLDRAVPAQPRTRISAIRTNLQQAVDFCIQRSDAKLPTGRLRRVTPRRIAAITRLLTTLSDRATRCVLLAARGFTNTQISDYLQVAPGTVARSLQEAYRHLGVAGRSDLDIPALLTLPKPQPAW